MNRKFKKTTLNNFCTIINVFTVTFAQFNASLVNKSKIYLNPPDSAHFNCSVTVTTQHTLIYV